MGCWTSQTHKNAIQNIGNQIKDLTKVEFSRKILEVVLDTLDVIGKKFPDFDRKPPHEKSIKIDFEAKDLDELKTQLELNSIIFLLSRKDFPHQHPEKKALRMLELYFEYFTKVDIQISHYCEIVINAIKGIQGTGIQDWIKKQQQRENLEKRLNRKILKTGVQITLMKEEIQTNMNSQGKTEKTTIAEVPS